MKKLAALVLAALPVAAFAAPETFVIDSNHSMPRFAYSHMGFSQQESRFDKLTGTITIDRAAKTGSVDVSIDTKTVDSGFPTFNEHLQGEDFFDTAKYPTITFKSTGVKFDGDNVAAVDGALTIKGVTKPVTLKVESFKCMPHPMLKKEACGATATVTIKRSDFNAGKYAPLVSDEVVLTLPVESIKQ
ncbi:MAG: polyisoprenoid-binding protein [Burkholderiaceae bacterium]|nr:polyisoprenoid-binding protein [Burkholderiaceae bacterium]